MWMHVFEIIDCNSSHGKFKTALDIKTIVKSDNNYEFCALHEKVSAHLMHAKVLL